MSLRSLINLYREGILSFTWRQWGQLGVFASVSHRDRWCQDPEALVAFSLEVMRWEPRMFDELLDWLIEHHDELTWQRLKNLMAQDPGTPNRVIEAAYELAAPQKAAAKRAARVGADPVDLEPLFRGEAEMTALSGEPDPVFLAFGLRRPVFHRSGKSASIRRAAPIAFAFQLRAVFGASGRAEALRYLLTRPGRQAGTVEIAEAASLSRYGLNQALDELFKAGMVQKGARTQKDLIWWLEDMRPFDWLRSSDGEFPSWVGWPSVYRGLSLLWRWLQAPTREAESAYIQASGAKELMRQVIPLLADQGLSWRASEPDEYRGAAYLDAFIQDIEGLLRALNESDAHTHARYAAIHEAVAHHPFRLNRVFEVPKGSLDLPECAGEARNLSIRWNPFGDTSAIAKHLVLDGDDRQLFYTFNSQPGKILEGGTYEGRTSDGAKLELEGVIRSGYSTTLPSNEVRKLQLEFQAVRHHLSSEHAPRYVRYILSNVHFPVWPGATRTSDGAWSRDTLSFTFAGETLHLTKLDESPSLAALVLDFELDERHNSTMIVDLPDFLSFLMGVEVTPLARELFDAEGELLVEELYSTNAVALSPRYEPLDWTGEQPNGALLAWKLPEIMSVAFARFSTLQKAVNLSAIVHCTIVANTARLGLSGQLRGLSLKMMREAYALSGQAMSERGKALALSRMLEQLQIPVNETAELLLQEPEGFGRHLLKPLADQPDVQTWLSEQGMLLTLSNACLLRLLGYTGPVVNYGVEGYPPLWVGPESGGTPSV